MARQIKMTDLRAKDRPKKTFPSSILSRRPKRMDDTATVAIPTLRVNCKQKSNEQKSPFSQTVKSRNLHSHPVEIGANDGADEEDGELKYAKDEAVLGGHAALLLGLVRVEGRLHGDGHGVAEVDHDEGERDEPLLAAEVHAEHCCGVENRLFASRVSRFLALRYSRFAPLPPFIYASHLSDSSCLLF